MLGFDLLVFKNRSLFFPPLISTYKVIQFFLKPGIKKVNVTKLSAFNHGYKETPIKMIKSLIKLKHGEDVSC